MSEPYESKWKNLFYDKLPIGIFSKKEAEDIGNEFGFSERTVKRMLADRFVFEKIKHGFYSKLQR